MSTRRVLTGMGLAVALGVFVWRELSRKQSLPCPSTLSPLLENTWFEQLAGTEETLRRIGLRPGQRVLEIGPGPGRLLIPASTMVLPGGEVVGLDIQPKMVERLMARAREAGVTNLRTVVGDAAEPHFAPETFDVVYLVTVLGEIPNREAALDRAYEVLKPGGRLSITEIFPDPHFQARGTVEALAQDAGFRLDSIDGGWNFFTANFVK